MSLSGDLPTRALVFRLRPMTQVPCYLSGLRVFPGVVADFVGRIPDIEVDTDRQATVNRLTPAHQKHVQALGFDWEMCHRAEQVHGVEIAAVSASDPARTWEGADGLITADAGLLLGIYVADCGAVYIVDSRTGALGLLHSGKKGSDENITGKAISMMQEKYGSRPGNLHVALAPCIRPPAYEVDFAAMIRQQVIASGVPEDQFTDSGICTTSDLGAYYSYRLEKGSTGRMLALLGRR